MNNFCIKLYFFLKDAWNITSFLFSELCEVFVNGKEKISCAKVNSNDMPDTPKEEK